MVPWAVLRNTCGPRASCFRWGLQRLWIAPEGSTPKADIFTLSHRSERFIFCCTFRSLAAPSISLASLFAKSGLSSSAEAKAIAYFPPKVYRWDQYCAKRLCGLCVKKNKIFYHREHRGHRDASRKKISVLGGDFAASAFCRRCCAFDHFSFLPVVNAWAVFAEDEVFPFADDVLVLRG